MNHLTFTALCLLCGFTLAAQAQPLSIRSGAVLFEVQQERQSLYLNYFGPADRRDAAQSRQLLTRWFEGLSTVNGRDAIRVTLNPRAPKMTLETCFDQLYLANGQTGVITTSTTVANETQFPVQISRPSLYLPLPAGDYELTMLRGTWGEERQVVTEELNLDKPKEIVSNFGRSTSRLSPWFCLHNRTTGIRYLAQLAWSGNWFMRFSREEGGTVCAAMGARFDPGARLAPDTSIDLPSAAFTATSGDLDDAANQLHRYQREYVIAKTPSNDPPLVQFNSWYPFPGKMNIADMKRCVEVAADIGAEVFVLDAGWYNKKDWGRELGDWRPDKVAFPNGTAELAKYAHEKGLKFGIWVEPEVVGDQSDTFRQHPDWCLKRDGKIIEGGPRRHLNYAKPEVRKWMHGEMDRIIADHKLDWVKFDYNIDVGEQIDADDGSKPGDMLYNHIRGYYGFLDDLRKAYPKLVIENCSSGGLRFDLGMLAHTHTTWLSDRVEPKASVQLAYGATLEFTPAVCNHWMVGDSEDGKVNLSADPGWWDFMFRVPMNGQFGISSRVFDWNESLKQHAKENVALYKRIRGVIATGDAYHLTPPPAHKDPKGWMAIQYVSPDKKKSVVMAYRLGSSEPSQTLKLRGLEAAAKYRVSQDSQGKDALTGQQLATDGLSVALDHEWRAAVIEFTAP